MHILMLFLSLFPCHSFGGGIMDCLKKESKHTPETFIQSFLSRDDVKVSECYEIIADLREYMTVAPEQTAPENIGFFLLYKQEVCSFLKLLEDHDKLRIVENAKEQLLEICHLLLSAILPFFRRGVFILSDVIDLDENFQGKLKQAFDKWKFERVYGEGDANGFTNMRKSCFKLYVEAFVSEINELMKMDVDQIPLMIVEDRLLRIKLLFLKELPLLKIYTGEFELKGKILINQLGGYVRFRKNEGPKPVKSIAEILKEIQEMVSVVLKGMQRGDYVLELQ